MHSDKIAFEHRRHKLIYNSPYINEVTIFVRQKTMKTVSQKTVARLSLYRRLLNELLAGKVEHVYSHQLAQSAGVTAAQVRRDLMVVGYTGSPSRGYHVGELIKAIRSFLDAPTPQAIALVGVGNLGKAILAYFAGRRPNLAILAAFDSNPDKTNRVIHGCRCYHIKDLADVFARHDIRVAILAVPAQGAQEVADQVIRAGARGLVNFAPVPLRVPPFVYVEDIDITTSLEKVAYFARIAGAAKETSPAAIPDLRA